MLPTPPELGHRTGDIHSVLEKLSTSCFPKWNISFQLENDGKDGNKEISLTIQFLPADIKSLQTKLSYLIGEYRAGNTSATRNQIIAIADNLFQRNHLSKEQYSHIIHTL